MHVCDIHNIHEYHDIHEEASKQLGRVGSLLSQFGFWDQIQVIPLS